MEKQLDDALVRDFPRLYRHRHGRRGKRRKVRVDATARVRFEHPDSDGWWGTSIPGVTGAYGQGKTRASAERSVLSAARDIAITIVMFVRDGRPFHRRQAFAVLRRGGLSARLRNELAAALAKPPAGRLTRAK
jgi:hypothetical protein